MQGATSKFKGYLNDTANRYPFLSSEIFNCELNTVLEKFFEAPEPPQPATEGAEKSGEEEGDEEDEKDDKENKKITQREPVNLGGSDFRPPFADDDEEESTESGKTEEPAAEEAKEKEAEKPEAKKQEA